MYACHRHGWTRVRLVVRLNPRTILGFSWPVHAGSQSKRVVLACFTIRNLVNSIPASVLQLELVRSLASLPALLVSLHQCSPRPASLLTMPEGTVEVELVRGHGLKDVEAFGKSDPFAFVSCGDVKQRSRTIHDGGSNPVWNQSFLLEIPDGPHELDIAVFDQEKRGADEAMGTLTIPLIKLFAERHIPVSKYKVQCTNGKFEGELEVGLKFFPKVHHGVLEVHLLEAHGLLDTDTFAGKSDPYAVIVCYKETQKSRVIVGAGTSDPVWDQNFAFNVDNEVTEILIKLFDKDDLKADDALGTVTIPLHKVFAEGHVPPSKYKVLGQKGQPQGEISVALKFVPKV